MRLALLVLLIVGLPAAAQSASSVRTMEGALLKGSGPEAQRAVSIARAQPLSQADEEYVACVQRRLSTEPRINPSLGAVSSHVLLAYQTYWYRSIRNPDSRGRNEEVLRRALADQLSLPKSSDFSAIEPVLEKKLASEGLFALTGSTPPFHELMLWRQQSGRDFRVRLPEQEFTSHVVMLDDFKSMGWAAWATCDRRSTGGWATETTLYAVMPRYPLGVKSNEFIAVLLTHETQHFADKNTFRDMKPWELEYRGKLAELWASDAGVAVERLTKFMNSQSEDENLAHPYANARVIADLAKILGKAPVDAGNDLHEAAMQLLRQDTARRNKRSKLIGSERTEPRIHADGARAADGGLMDAPGRV